MRAPSQLLGSLGGVARARKLSAVERSQIASTAAKARWAKYRLQPPPAPPDPVPPAPTLDWDAYFILEAYVAAMKSKDDRTQVGVCIVGPDGEIRSKGYNGPCRGENDADPALYAQPLRRLAFEHAERNAIYNLARIGVAGKGCVMYSTLHPCIDCGRGVVQCGIREIVLPADYPGARVFNASQTAAAALFVRVGVVVRWWHGPLPSLMILSDGQSYRFHAG
jgi:dCMP deaminase